MVYLDYSATTPVLDEVIDSYIKITKSFIGNPNSLHSLGFKSRDLMENATKQIAEIFEIEEKELIYTSGATESNNLALIGYALTKPKESQIIISKLEHPSIYEIAKHLEELGYKIIEVNNNEEGLIDLDDLKNKMSSKTILVSICAVNSELGIRQPLKTIRQIIKKVNPKTALHSDITQCLGKATFNMRDVDMASASGHKIYAPKGIGFLYKSSSINLKPIIYGNTKSNELRPGTPALPLIASLSKAIRIALSDIDRKEEYIEKLNKKICDFLKEYKSIKINNTKYSIPHIINISLMNIKPETFIHAMEEREVFIGSNTACASGSASSSVLAVYNDMKRAQTTIRISLSYLTTNEEVNKFLNCFKYSYQNLNF